MFERAWKCLILVYYSIIALVREESPQLRARLPKPSIVTVLEHKGQGLLAVAIQLTPEWRNQIIFNHISSVLVCHTLASAIPPFPLPTLSISPFLLIVWILSLLPQLLSFTETSPLLRLMSPQCHVFRQQQEMPLLCFQIHMAKSSCSLSPIPPPPTFSVDDVVCPVSEKMPSGRQPLSGCSSVYTLT